MKNLLLVSAFLVSVAANASGPAIDVPPKPRTVECMSTEEKERLLALEEQAFDQDLSGGGGGWRAIANRVGCDIAAADLIRDYRERHASKNAIIFWHEGQLRAMGNDYAAAIALFDKSRKPAEQDMAGWNPYVDASIAFLRKDRQALLASRSALMAVKAPKDLNVKDGVADLTDPSGKPFRMRWPLNIDVVDGLIKCFDRSYRDAYAGDTGCRPEPLKQPSP